MAKHQIEKTGVCKLTGERGNFARSHIIPRALTKPRAGGEAFAQFGGGKRPVRRRNSWYDPQLVIHKGEALLRDYDTWGIRELRRTKLVWRSWGPMQKLSTKDFLPFKGTDWGVRRVTFSDPKRMRLFLLSLLWRAATTNLQEFSEIKIRASDLKKLTKFVREGVLPPNSFFPVTMTQISTVGYMHNLSPIAQNKEANRILGIRIPAEDIFRFYFDGLVIHFYRRPRPETLDGIKHMAVGSVRPINISTVTFERSWQLLNLQAVENGSERTFPGGILRVEGKA